MEYYSSIKKDKIMKSASKWADPEIIILNEVTQNQRGKGCIFSLILGWLALNFQM